MAACFRPSVGPKRISSALSRNLNACTAIWRESRRASQRWTGQRRSYDRPLPACGRSAPRSARLVSNGCCQGANQDIAGPDCRTGEPGRPAAGTMPRPGSLAHITSCVRGRALTTSPFPAFARQ
jgi:hypothetical protein